MLKLIKFENPTCQPCKALEPVLTKLKESYDFELVKVDTYTDEGAEMAQNYRVMSTPTVIIEKDGEKVDCIIGAASMTSFETVVRCYSK